ncbi:methyltransferase domain-containing protein [Yinghuangia aomiensis]|uniref:Protein-L-isoaspartate O-methyltransferase n=1 Tax=Yinghuangia aomiensis TaxID=676205 RepID=A0ABP9GLT6_9ACTN
MTSKEQVGGVGENISLALLGRDRAPFIPAVFHDDVLVDRAVDAERWRAAVNADAVIVTQWNDGVEDAAGERVATCSCSMPTTVRKMVDALDVREGHRVLEVGTGTGYTAALLRDRVGPTGHVVSVEVDEGLARIARENLAAVGVDVQAVSGDGLDGYAEGGPYDRVFVTCGIRTVPAAWLSQAVTGARIVMPWGTQFMPSHDVLVALVKAADGSASGRFAEGLSYMKARSQRTAWPTFPEGWIAAARSGESDVPASTVDIGSVGFMPLVVGFALPDVMTTVLENDGSTTRYLYRNGSDGESCAAVTYADGSPTATYTYGPDDLAGKFIAAAEWFRDHGRPEPEGFGLTVTPDGQRVWFGTPYGPTSPKRPAAG